MRFQICDERLDGAHSDHLEHWRLRYRMFLGRGAGRADKTLGLYGRALKLGNRSTSFRASRNSRLAEHVEIGLSRRAWFLAATRFVELGTPARRMRQNIAPMAKKFVTKRCSRQMLESMSATCMRLWVSGKIWH